MGSHSSSWSSGQFRMWPDLVTTTRFPSRTATPSIIPWDIGLYSPTPALSSTDSSLKKAPGRTSCDEHESPDGVHWNNVMASELNDS